VTRYVTTADALFFHKMLIERCGGSAGVRDIGALESALRRPQSGYYESVREPELLHGPAGAVVAGKRGH
jgi:death on curing protein